jgi:hypothetical protein
MTDRRSWTERLAIGSPKKGRIRCPLLFCPRFGVVNRLFRELAAETDDGMMRENGLDA